MKCPSCNSPDVENRGTSYYCLYCDQSYTSGQQSIITEKDAEISRLKADALITRNANINLREEIDRLQAELEKCNKVNGLLNEESFKLGQSNRDWATKHTTLYAENLRLQAELDESEKLLGTSTRHVQSLMGQVDRLQALLDEIAEHPHCIEKPRMEIGDYDSFDDYEYSQYLGHIKGHRCAAAIARKAKEWK